MEYRELGKTGLKTSVIGLGGEHIDFKPYQQVKTTIDMALDHGVNIIDICMPGTEIRENIAKALGSKRDSVIIQGHVCSSDINRQYDICRDMPTVKKYFEGLLRAFGYIDIGVILMIDTEQDYKDVFETEVITYVEHLKKQGDIKHIGFSSHHPETSMKAINTGIPEMLMFSINPAFDMLPGNEYIFDYIGTEFQQASDTVHKFDLEKFRGVEPKRAELYKLCSKKQVGITVMKPFGGGKLISPQLTPFKKPMTPIQCLHYALSRPAVSSVLPGCKDPDEVKDLMRYFEADDTEKDYTWALSAERNDFIGNCVYCSHCQPCPAGIDIANVHKYLDIARTDTDNIPDSIYTQYQTLPKRSECTACGHCEGRCPFGVPIISNIAEAEELLQAK